MRACIQGVIGIVVSLALSPMAAIAAGPPPEIKGKLDNKIAQLRSWSTDPTIVAAVKASNAAPPAAAKEMTNARWKSLTVLDPFVRSFSKNPLGLYLKGKQDPHIAECFVSGANGTKVAFLAKTSSWSHADKDKHRVPMTGNVWIGPIEVDESTGQQQIQVGIPVLDSGKPIGSIVVGLAIARL